MALQGGHRFTVSMDEAFPHGLYALGVAQAMDYSKDARGKSVSTPTADKVTGSAVWNVTCIDRDEEARARQVTIKVLAPVCPTLPEEIAPGSGIRPVVFEGLQVTAYVDSKTDRLAYSYRATGVTALGRPRRGEQNAA